MDDFDRNESDRERNEGLAYEDWWERRGAGTAAAQECPFCGGDLAATHGNPDGCTCEEAA